eukprot:3645027-Prymnesium_polylepis.1
MADEFHRARGPAHDRRGAHSGAPAASAPPLHVRMRAACAYTPRPACEQPACALWPARISELGLVRCPFRSPGSLTPPPPVLARVRVCPRIYRPYRVR